MAAHVQSTVSLPKYGRSSTDNWNDFESPFRSTVEATGIQANQRLGLVKLQLKSSALQFLYTLEANTRADLKITIEELKNCFCSRTMRENLQIDLENMTFTHKTETREKFLIKFQMKQ